MLPRKIVGHDVCNALNNELEAHLHHQEFSALLKGGNRLYYILRRANPFSRQAGFWCYRSQPSFLCCCHWFRLIC
jgi:hypothetical protein